MKCLLTGGRAFVSRTIGPALLADRHDVTVCLRPGQPVPEWLAEADTGVTARWVDLAGDDGLRGLVAGHDAIIHVAGRLEEPRAPAAVFERDNTRATQALINGALSTGCRRIINFSSMSVYGSIDRDLVDETTPSLKPTPYGASKLAAEAALRRAAPGLASVSLRLPGIVGPHAHDNWLSRCRAALRSGVPVEIANPDFNFNNIVHVSDLARFIITLLGRDWTGASAFPIGAGAPLSILELLKTMKEVIGSGSPINTAAHGRRPFAISSDRAIREFGYRPVPVRDIIERFANDA